MQSWHPYAFLSIIACFAVSMIIWLIFFSLGFCVPRDQRFLAWCIVDIYKILIE